MIRLAGGSVRSAFVGFSLFFIIIIEFFFDPHLRSL